MNEGDLVVPAPDDFSLFDMLDGVEYPESSVTVAINEKAAFALGRLDREIKEYLRDNDEHDEKVLAKYRERVDALKQQIEDSKITFHLKGVPDELVTGANEIAEEKFKDRKKQVKTADGRIVKILPDGEKINFMRYSNAVVVSMHVTKVVYHKNGAERTTPSPDEIAAFYDKAPAAAKAILGQAVNELRVDAIDYERNFDEGFFPKS